MGCYWYVCVCVRDGKPSMVSFVSLTIVGFMFLRLIEYLCLCMCISFVSSSFVSSICCCFCHSLLLHQSITLFSNYHVCYCSHPLLIAFFGHYTFAVCCTAALFYSPIHRCFLGPITFWTFTFPVFLVDSILGFWFIWDLCIRFGALARSSVFVYRIALPFFPALSPFYLYVYLRFLCPSPVLALEHAIVSVANHSPTVVFVAGNCGNGKRINGVRLWDRWNEKGKLYETITSVLIINPLRKLNNLIASHLPLGFPEPWRASLAGFLLSPEEAFGSVQIESWEHWKMEHL